jgi:hypothetical protein
VKVVLAYKNFAANKNVSHIGLGVAAMNIQKCLIRAGIRTLVWPIISSLELCEALRKDPEVTHVVLSAPWIPSIQIQEMVNAFPDVSFAMTCHSNVGFLQADSNALVLIRQAMEIERSTPNFHVAGNSNRFCEWVRRAYSVPCTFLPNLYYLDETTNSHRPTWTSGPLRIGAFGAMRPLKNFMSAAGAALEMAQQLRADTELWLSVGRTEGGGETVMRAVREMLRGLQHITLVENGWETWPQFRSTVSHMHLLLQPSYSESFNMVTADGIASGVPSVVSGAIDWCPAHWKAPVDDVVEIARVGRSILSDSRAAQDGLAALQHHNSQGLNAWKRYLGYHHCS